jgi:hypothetical protein
MKIFISFVNIPGCGVEYLVRRIFTFFETDEFSFRLLQAVDNVDNHSNNIKTS